MPSQKEILRHELSLYRKPMREGTECCPIVGIHDMKGLNLHSIIVKASPGRVDM